MWISKSMYHEKIQKAFNDGKRSIEKDLEQNNKDLLKRYQNAETIRLEVQKKYDELRSKVREQSEADMVLSALRVILKAANGEKKDEINPYYSSMLAAQQQARAMGGLTASYGGLLNALGL